MVGHGMPGHGISGTQVGGTRGGGTWDGGTRNGETRDGGIVLSTGGTAERQDSSARGTQSGQRQI